ncbi:splicing factor 3B subunit 1 [Dorcoceras hygrometricum]|uniref:Splicing factor 3B subunit 1 n=1 Tax=Dorcoceras hygrometricum TaxID=472368 RepID=A0A2Z7BUT9_9LAMI|nr:splicing factor 3B subunit 1 [Dorcoceras hygrometricum]
MVKMFKALECSGLKGFLGCSSAIYEAALVEFFQNASVQDDKVICTVQEKSVEFTEEVFAGTFDLPTEGLTDMSDVPKYLVFDARTAFSYDGEQLNTSCKKREMKFDFHLLNDILAKTVTVKAGSFDAVTHERFLMMSAINGGVKVNWGRLLFNIFKDMVTPATKQARGYAVQICILLMGATDLELGESKDFSPLKILTEKTVGTYVAKNKNITVDVDEPTGDEPVLNNKAASKRRPAPTVGESVTKKKRTTVGRAAPTDNNLALFTVAQDVEPISTVPAVTPRASRFQAQKRKLVLQTGSDDEIVDSIIHQVIADTTAIETGEPYLEEPGITRSVEIEMEQLIVVNDEDDNLDRAKNEISRKMASFTAPKQFLI